jgi:molybdenum cofactor biosynthesis enzyme MoaA
MIKTLSICPTCYKKIQAEISFQNGMVVMSKTCDVHGPFTSVVEKDIQHFAKFYEHGTLGRNNTIIIHAHNQCNMKCSWCYYPMGVEKMHDAEYFDMVLRQYKGQFNLLLSGGEPTLRPDYFEFVRKLRSLGWPVSSITNMISLADEEFFNKTMNHDFVNNKFYNFSMSFQHPKNYSEEIKTLKFKAIERIELSGLKAMCVMFSIQSLDELDYIREFYNHTKHCYFMIRIRTMFKNWANKNDKTKIFSSDLYKAFFDKFHDLMPIQSRMIESSNIYCQYLTMDNGMNVSLSSAPTVDNVDYHLCTRPVYMLALDGRCYPVPITQIINEGIDSGWKDGFEVKKGDSICSQ